MDARTRGLQALAELYLDPTVRQARVEELGDKGVEDLGKRVLRQDEFSRLADGAAAREAAATAKEAEAAALYDSNKAWFDQKQKDLEELDRLRRGVQPDPATRPDPAKPDPKYLTEEQYTARIAETERGAVAFFSDLNTLSLQHFQQFGELLDTQKLLTNPRVQQVGLRGVYAEVYKPQLDARAAKLAQEAEDKIRADERTKVLAAQASSTHPYPVRGNEPSTLDVLEAERAGQSRAGKTVDEMAAEYARLGAVRSGVPV